jgi:pimeloyl-ACP methyl ester carboxylesterase
MDAAELRQGSVTLESGLEVAYLAADPAAGAAADAPLAMCLHGFPDSARTWRHLLPELADAGYRAVAPWLRGYAPTAVPADGRYQNGAIAVDANELHAALDGGPDAVLVGHDWGARAATGAAVLGPDRWRRLVTLAVPPMGAVGEGFFSYRQLRKSWYMFFFQHPLSDVVVGMNDLAFIDRLWEDWSPGHDGAKDITHVKDSLRDPSNLAAALGYYRATLGDGKKAPEYDAIEATAGSPPTMPVLYLHGRTDGCMGADLAASAGAFLPSPGSRTEIVDDAGHFLHLERPAEVNRLVIDFLTG